MKKTFNILLAALLVAGAAITSSAVEQSDVVEINTEDYPGSVLTYELDAATDGDIMVGSFYRLGSCYGDGYTEATVVDGDYTTYFAPVNNDYTPQNQLIMKMDEPYTVSEIRFFGRDEKFERTISLCFDASNDGENWTTLYETQDVQDADEFTYVIIPSSDFDYNGGFTYFRVHQVDPSLPLNLAEVEWWGVKSAASTDAPVNERADGTDTDVAPYVAPTYTYPASGLEGNLITGELIGNETGWDGTEASGRKSVFDGNPSTFFDPLGVGDGYIGIKSDEAYVLEKVAILSRSAYPDRFLGAMIQGSNDGENWTTLWTSDAAAESVTEYTIVTDFENNTGYTMYRYFNETSHGDVAEVEFYSYSDKAEEAAPAAEEVVEAPAVEEAVEAPIAEEVIEIPAAEEVTEAPAAEVVSAPQTFDAGIVAAVAAVVSLAGYAVSKRK